MPNTSIENILYSRGKDPLEFKFDNIPPAPPILSFMTVRDIEILHHTATSLKYSGNMKKKYKIIDKVMTNRGFVHFHTGTNRIVYRPLESYDFLVKIALDRAGLTDSPNEYKNQFLLQPFITKVFECTPCGTIATVERVKPLIRKEEFISVAGDIFDLINKKIIGKYILDDIGSDYFMNWGTRIGLINRLVL